MHPLIEVHRIGTEEYSYQIRAGAAPAYRAEIAFDSLESCLFDAGDWLGDYFVRVQVVYEGRSLGQCSTAMLRRVPGRVADSMGSPSCFARLA